MRKRIEVALVAIHARMRELGASLKFTEERQSLNDALSALQALQRGFG